MDANIRIFGIVNLQNLKFKREELAHELTRIGANEMTRMGSNNIEPMKYVKK